MGVNLVCMEEAATIAFKDFNSMDEAYAIVRFDGSSVALCLSLKSNGDLEVVMRKEDAILLLEALKVAVR